MLDQIETSHYCPLSPAPPLPPAPPTLPPPLNPPQIFHISTSTGLSTSQTLLSLLSSHLPLSSSHLLSLSSFGSIYLQIPPKNPNQSPKPLRQTPKTLQSSLPENTPFYVRVHAAPKRHFPTRPLRVICQIGDIIALDKPKGLPVVPTTDNVEECVLHYAAQLLGLAKVFVTSRLDIGTSGVLLVATTSKGAKLGNRMLTGEHCYKRYVVDTVAKPTVGKLKHWYYKRVRLNGLREKDEVGVKDLLKEWDEEMPGGGGWVLAELDVEQVWEGFWGWRSKVRLLTGRTHQIRAQFGRMGWGVVGDLKYGGREVVAAGDRVIGLHAWRVEGVIEGEGSVLFEAEVEDIEAAKG